MRLSDMLSNTVELPVKFDGEEVLVSYRPNAITLEVSDQIDAEGKAAEEAEEAGEPTDFSWITAQLVPVIEWWDVLEDDGSRMEPSRENMRRVPVKFLRVVLESITDAQKVTLGEDEGSEGGS